MNYFVYAEYNSNSHIRIITSDYFVRESLCFKEKVERKRNLFCNLYKFKVMPKS
jgi:hypothetical protein